MRAPLLLAAALLAAAPAAALTVQEVASLDNPWGMAFLPDGRALITEKPGRMRLLRTDGTLSPPLPGLPAVKAEGQIGLLDVAVARTFATTGHIYFTYTEDAGGGTSRLVLAEARLSGESLADVRAVWRANPATFNGHPGGRIVITSNMSFYVTTGDRQQFTPAQDPGVSWGKIVRVNRKGEARSGNPFLDDPDYRPEIWTLGHRNPYGLVWDAARKILWSHEMGPAGGDELNVIVAGRNYGWPEVSEGDHYDGEPIPRHSSRPEFAAPAYAWPTTVAPSGLILYTATRFPGWKGSLLAGSLAGQSLFRITTSGTAVTGVERFPLGRRIRDVEQGPDGAIWLLQDGSGGKLLKVTP
jgi:glucose/arabinose dehydrogenase